MNGTHEFHEQVRHDRMREADDAALRRRLISQRRARRKLERAERAARQARLVLSTGNERPVLRVTEGHA